MRSALTIIECEMNGATVDGGTGQFSLHSTICTSLCVHVVLLLQPPPSGGRDAVKSYRVVPSGGIGVLLDYKVQNMAVTYRSESEQCNTLHSSVIWFSCHSLSCCINVCYVAFELRECLIRYVYKYRNK